MQHVTQSLKGVEDLSPLPHITERNNMVITRLQETHPRAEPAWPPSRRELTLH